MPPPYLDNASFIDFKKNQPNAISLGISPYSPWDLDMANIGYRVLQYDASIEKAPYKHENIIFHKKFVGIKDDENTISLNNVITKNHLDENSCNVLQCDIEDCEWEILEQIDLSNVARYFPQVIFEFHNCNPNDKSLSLPRLAILERILQYYTPIHTHFNCYGEVFYSNGYFWDAVVEVSYLRNDLIPANAKKIDGIGNLNIDAPNAKGYPDIPVIF